METLNKSNKSPKYLTLLTMLVPVLWIACILSQDRLVTFEGGYFCAAVLPYPFLCIVFDLIAEIYGYKEARKTLWYSFITIYIFVFSVYGFAKLPAPAFMLHSANAFNSEMTPLLRILFFNSIALIIGQYINVYILSKLRILLKGKFFALRSIGSTFVGDTITFAVALFGDFSGLIKSHGIFVLVIDELAIMYLMAIILAFPASIVVTMLKSVEPDFNPGVEFNPFK